MSMTKQAGEKSVASRNEVGCLLNSARNFAARRMSQGTLSRGRSKCAEICSARQSCRRSTACLRCVSCRGTGIPAPQQETFSGKYRRFGTAFSVDAGSRVGRRCALRRMLARLVYSRIDTRKSHNGAAARKTAHIANLGHKLRGSDFANAVHGMHCIVLWQLPRKACHLGAQSGQRHLACKQLLGSSRNQQLCVVVLRQRGEMAAASGALWTSTATALWMSMTSSCCTRPSAGSRKD